MVASWKERALANAMRKNMWRGKVPECLRQSGNIISPLLDRGLAAYMSNMNACVAHLKCCEPKYARKFPLLTVN